MIFTFVDCFKGSGVQSSGVQSKQKDIVVTS